MAVLSKAWGNVVIGFIIASMAQSPNHIHHFSPHQLEHLVIQIKQWGKSLGFQQLGISDCHLEKHEAHLKQWLADGHHGAMDYMQHHGLKRSRPETLIPGTLRIISARFDYLPEHHEKMRGNLNATDLGYISRYATGRDYHKVLRQRLKKLTEHIANTVHPFGFRVFVDSAPVLEKALAEKAGLGWIGKHTNLINKKAGSWFFLGEVYTDLPLPTDTQSINHCGSCTNCLDICPTQAIIAPYKLDARRCITYLTVEYKGSIPISLRPMIGNRIFGCDDCQLFCPWNKFAIKTVETDFTPREKLTNTSLIDYFSWTEDNFKKLTEGTPIRRTSYECWLRNISVALGNAPTSESIIAALHSRLNDESALVREHTQWALSRHVI